ncbi:multiple sugar transport system ATP-binding protein [Actimicrobium sp. GrIS 1.19]|uniref:ABC transporter ATP-binding protein n=1 Tax=Actimicrobium sp. GrIS 1.19 TaxID=3071708 RepID=UPI002E0B3A4D|nr:multiple sugar transport system ATP-binding protein [Actimicrobium sp. GrIS 1.19]
MAGLQLTGIKKSFGDVKVLHGIDLDIADGEFIVFVGPSGCGKSTLLRAICGLEEITAGELKIGARLVNDIPPAQRGIAMVFQSYALYPHMSVFDNMAFGLKLAGDEKGATRNAVMHAAKVLHIEPLLERKPKELSGGQRQRVAIGRAIVRKPDVFLFDEPLSNLDASLRVQMRIELANLHRELRATMLYVTHDQIEAMTLADRIVVLNAGRIEQVGKPLELYHRPDNLFVAGFLGSPRMNFFKGSVRVGGHNNLTVGIGDATFDVDTTRTLAVGTEVTIGARPEHITLGDNPGGVPVEVHAVEHLGDVSYIYVTVAGSDVPLVVRSAPDREWEIGQKTALTIAPGWLHVFDEDGRACR